MRYFFLIFFLTPLLSAASGSVAQEWQEADAAAAELMEQGEWRKARKQAERAVKLSAKSDAFNATRHADLVFQLADIHNELGNLTGIQRVMNKGISVVAKRSGGNDPEVITIYQRLGNILQGAGEFADGRRAFLRAALKTERAYGKADLRTLTAKFGLIDWESRFRAIGFHRARKKIKNLAGTIMAGDQSSFARIYDYYWRGRIHLYYGKMEEAQSLLLQAVQEARKHPDAEHLLSDIYRELANFHHDRGDLLKRQSTIEEIARLSSTARDRAIIQISPRYSRGARTRAVRVWVDVDIDVLASGKVAEVFILESNGNDVLEADITEAIKSWIFPPGYAEGEFIPYTITGLRLYFFAPNRANRFGR